MKEHTHDQNLNGEAATSQAGPESRVLSVENLRSRRAFLKRAVKRCALPAIVVYSVHKMTPPAFGRTPI